MTLPLPFALMAAPAVTVFRTQARLQQPLLAVFPHGLQHHARRNAYQALGQATAGRRERQAVDAEIAALGREPVRASSLR